MHPLTLEQLIPVLQVAIGPVILISGVGLLLLGTSNRYGRTIDRARELVHARRATERAHIDPQIEILWLRARWLRRSILYGSLSVLFAVVLIITLFIAALANVEVASLITIEFVACMLSLAGSIGASILDVNQSLKALKLELDERS